MMIFDWLFGRQRAAEQAPATGRKPLASLDSGPLTKQQRQRITLYREAFDLLREGFKTQGEMTASMGYQRTTVSKIMSRKAKYTYLKLDQWPRSFDPSALVEALESRGRENGDGGEEARRILRQLDAAAVSPEVSSPAEVAEEPALEPFDVNEMMGTGSYRIIFEGFDYAKSIDFNDPGSYPVKVWTYTLADVKKLYGSIPDKFWPEVFILLDSDNEYQADMLHDLTLGNLNLRLDKFSHRKIVLHSGSKILIGSANFGHTLNRESVVEISSEAEHGWLEERHSRGWEANEPWPPDASGEHQVLHEVEGEADLVELREGRRPYLPGSVNSPYKQTLRNE